MKPDRLFKRAPFATVAWIWTLTYSIGLVFFAIRCGIIIANGGFPDVIDTFFTVALLIILVMAYLRSVRAYSIEDGNLVIIRSGPGRINISLDDIVGAVDAPTIGSFFNVNLLSTGGVFGWSGKVRVRNPSDLKSIDAEVYGTNPKYSVLLELRSKRKVIITPAEPREMETALRAAGAGAHVSDNRPRIGEEVAERADKPKPWLQGNKK